MRQAAVAMVEMGYTIVTTMQTFDKIVDYGNQAML